MKMTTTKKKLSRILCAAMALVALTAFAGCSTIKAEDYPDALCVTNGRLIGYQSAIVKGESTLVMSIVDAAYNATYDAVENKSRHIALTDAAAFPTDEKEGVIEPGGIYKDTIKKFVPEDRNLCIASVRGSVIRAIAETTIEAYLNSSEENFKAKANEVFCFTGIAFVYDKDAKKNGKVIDTVMLGDDKLTDTEIYSVAVNDDTLARLIEKFDADGSKELITVINESAGSELDAVSKYLGENGLSSYNSRFISKADRDTPSIVVTVLIVVAVLALAGIVTAYFVMKNKQKKARAKRGGQPRIDV